MQLLLWIFLSGLIYGDRGDSYTFQQIRRNPDDYKFILVKCFFAVIKEKEAHYAEQIYIYA